MEFYNDSCFSVCLKIEGIKHTSWMVKAVPAAWWERVYDLAVLPLFLTVKVCLKVGNKQDGNTSNRLLNSQSLIVGGVVEDELTGGDRGGGEKGIVDVDETGALLSEGLGKRELILGAPDADGGSLKESACSPGCGGSLALDLEQESGRTSGEGGGHGSTRHDGEATQGDGEKREDVATRSADCGLEVEVVGRPVGGEGRHQTAGGVLDVDDLAALRERELDRSVGLELLDKLCLQVSITADSEWMWKD